MKKFPMFNEMFFSKNLFEDLNKEKTVEKIRELAIDGFFGPVSIKVKPEKFMPENCAILAQNGIIVAVYKNGKFLVVPEKLREKIRKKTVELYLEKFLAEKIESGD
jgi:hypothetical protein